eukprot:TRINITY_DN13560_c0_g1_i2.p1 TRINITY_DN13560_c0_g1~~TRINITY_DN13560_c0_g1_i2.p1  ORF type:complete len:124 (+),score=12.76 TRINITY_DN13560_c0_g1_i2:472-843(+)
MRGIVEALKENWALQSLVVCKTGNEVDHNEIGDEGAKAVAETIGRFASPKLDLCNDYCNKLLGHNKIGDEGVKAIAEALETNTTITELNLGENMVQHAGAVAIAKFLQTNSSVFQLNLCKRLQ